MRIVICKIDYICERKNNHMWQLFLEGVISTSWLEFVAVISGLLSVWYCRKANILVFPTGIISVLIYVYICFNYKLYADAGINLFYFLMSVYGWIHWTRGSGKDELEVTKNSKKQQIFGISSVILLYGLVFGLLWIFKKDDPDYINSYLPYVDSFTTSIFFVAMWYQARKKVESWVYWIIGDIISIPLYFVKGWLLLVCNILCF